MPVGAYLNTSTRGLNDPVEEQVSRGARTWVMVAQIIDEPQTFKNMLKIDRVVV